MRSDTPIVGCSPDAQEYFTECPNCGRDVEMQRMIFDYGKEFNRIRGFLGVCEYCKANTVDLASLELMKKMGVVREGELQ